MKKGQKTRRGHDIGKTHLIKRGYGVDIEKTI